MSTTIKRVALVAVAALSLGVVSVAPSQAVSQADSLTLSATTASQLTGETLTAGSASVTLAYLGGAATDSMTVSAFLISAPAGSTTLPALSVSDTTNAIITSGGAQKLTNDVITSQVAGVQPTASTKAVSAKFFVYLNGPTVVGTYVIKLTPAVAAGGGTVSGSAQTLTITVATNPATDTVAASATSLLNSGETVSATADAVVTSSKALSTTAGAATIVVALKNAAGVAVTAESYTATVSGPGVLGTGLAADVATIAPLGRAIPVQYNGVVQLFPDGTAGVSTVTISSAAGKVLATETVTFFGAAATISTPTVVKTVIGTGGTTGVLTVSIKDAAGVNVSNLAGTLSVVSDSATIASSVYAAGGTYDATTGLYTLGVTGNAAGIANIKVSTNASSTDTTGVSSAAAAVRVGSYTPASVKVTTDKSSYAPGELATLTVQLFDANGLEVVSGETYTAIFATGGIVASYTVTGAATNVTELVSYASGGKTFAVYLPVTEGDVKFSWTTGSTASGVKTGLATANQAVAGSVTVSVSSPSTAAATDAANEAAQAASDATDAAILAAEAADAATAAAQDAVDAVAALSTQVNKLISALKAQITTLTNLVIKIQKKVKA